MKIKEVENRVGMTRANIRYYEKEGLLNTTIRNENNYREYTEEDVQQLQKIKILRLLGVAPADIKLLNADAISMEEIMQKRMEELDRAAKEIQDIHRICETIVDKKIDVHSLNETILTGDRAVWMQRMEDILRKDIVNEIVTKKQVNNTIAGMLAWGYFLCAAVTAFIYTIGRESSLFEFVFNREADTYVLGILFVTLIVALFSLYYTANVIVHLISFHVSALVTPPLLNGAIRRMIGVLAENSSAGEASLIQLSGFWLILAGYVVLLYFLSLKWDKMFTKVRYTLIVAGAYAAFFVVIIAATCEYWILTALLLIYFVLFIGIKWTATVEGRNSYNRYYAVKHAGCIINIVGLNTWSVGYDYKS